MFGEFDLPLNAYLICYGPLLLTILGFVAFAVLTDLDARRTYLRRPMGKSDGPRKIDKAINAETPAGAPLTILPPERVKEAGEAPPEPPSIPTPATPPSETPPEPAAVTTEPGEPDDLTKLEGIGPKMADALVSYGLDTYEKVAAATVEDFQAAIEAAGMRFAPAAESWAEQATYAARGDWSGLEAFQNTLVSGRYPRDDD